MFGIALKYEQIQGKQIEVPRNPEKLPIDKAPVLPYMFPKLKLRVHKEPILKSTIDLHDGGYTENGSTQYGDPKHFYSVPFFKQ